MLTRRKASCWASGMLAVAGMLALGACGVSGVGAAKPTPTPDAATILASVQKVQYKDISFKMTLSGSSSGTDVSGDASGVITTSPKRAQVTMNLTTSGQQLAFDVIEDSATNTTYVKFNSAFIPGLPTDKWIKQSGSGSFDSLTKAFDTSQITNFGQISGATLKGTETVDGVQVWHLTGSETEGGTTGTADVYIRQDNHYPYKLVVHSAGGSSGDATITFTGINTGATVTLPTADQVMDLPSNP